MTHRKCVVLSLSLLRTILNVFCWLHKLNLKMSKGTKKQNITAICYDKRGRILSIGRNSYVKTHPLQARMAAKMGNERQIYLHAEIAALVKVRNWSLIEKMTVVRLNALGQPLNAKPCPICTEMIRLARIKIVEHT